MIISNSIVARLHAGIKNFVNVIPKKLLLAYVRWSSNTTDNIFAKEIRRFPSGTTKLNI